jgi:hypothetical protein
LTTACTPDAGTPHSAGGTSSNPSDLAIEEYRGVHAVLDEATLTVELPLDGLVSQDFDVQLLYFKSQLARIGRCIKSHGGSSTPNAVVAWDQIAPQENTTHGRWDVATAKKYGPNLDPRRGLPALEAIPLEQADLPLFSSCYQDLVKNPEDIDEEYRTPNFADRLRGDAIAAARESAEGQAALSDLHDCLADHGIDADSQGQPDSKYSAQSEKDQIVTATALAQCNTEHRVPHRLFDLQAKYETASIADHQDELAIARKEKQSFIKELESSINGD